MSQQLPQKLTYKATTVLDFVTFAASASESSVLQCGGMQVLSIRTPNVWTTSNITINAGVLTNGSDSLAVNLFDGNVWAPIVIPSVPANTLINLMPYWLCPYSFITFSSSSAAQASATQLNVFMQPLFQGIHG